MISLKGCQFPKDAVLYAVYFYLRYAVSYRELEEIMAERGVQVDHATRIRWVAKYPPMIVVSAQSKKRPTLNSCRVDETYVRVRGKWMYLYQAVDKAGNTLDFKLSERKNRPAAASFFAKALSSNGILEKIVIDKSGVNAAGIRKVNKILIRFGCSVKIQTVRSQYLNNLIEQDHKFIKRRIRYMCGFKSFRSASATLDGIEVANMIRKQQFPDTTTSGFRQFAEIAG